MGRDPLSFAIEVAAFDYFDDPRGRRDVSFQETAVPFTVLGSDLGESGVSARAGLKVPALGGEFGVFGDYEKAGEAESYGANISIGWQF